MNEKIAIVKALNMSLDTLNFRKATSFKDIALNDFVYSDYFNLHDKNYVKSIYVNREDENKAMVLVLIDNDEYLIPYSTIIKVEKC